MDAARTAIARMFCIYTSQLTRICWDFVCAKRATNADSQTTRTNECAEKCRCTNQLAIAYDEKVPQFSFPPVI